MATTLTQFEQDLIQFVKAHPYMQKQEAEINTKHFTESDSVTITCETPNAVYERTIIKIQHIS